MEKKTLAIIFGGQSSEHEISCKSAYTIVEAVDTDKYEIMLIGITKDGRWLLVEDENKMTDGTWQESTVRCVLLPDAQLHGVLMIDSDQKAGFYRVDIAWPVLHGLNGEDGTIQGLLTLAQIPFVGDGVLASAVGMDKIYTKIVVDDLGIAQARSIALRSEELDDLDEAIGRIETKIPYPVFVKPSRAGSSCGVSKATDRGELEKALRIAAAEDSKILVEGEIVGRELECAVFRAEKTIASGVGEILAAEEFYSYDAKYNNAESKTVVDPDLPEGVAEEIRADAVRIFDAIDGHSLARVDFFLEKDTNRVVFNEINTMPGFTSISMYPMLWEARGKDKKKLVDLLIKTAYFRR
ncbi:MAG: D-alanine--D-alanine ligase [Lachnospiraceae bacterium]|nr:D-alanine--D-alanine ligase [Lachnospiraceae bacterium]